MRIPSDVKLSIFSLCLLVLQFIVYRLQYRIGPRLKFLKLSSSENGYSYYREHQLMDSNDESTCPICFEELSEHIEFDSSADKLEKASLIVDYLGKIRDLDNF